MKCLSVYELNRFALRNWLEMCTLRECADALTPICLHRNDFARCYSEFVCQNGSYAFEYEFVCVCVMRTDAKEEKKAAIAYIKLHSTSVEIV